MRRHGAAVASAALILVAVTAWVRLSPLAANDLVGGDEGYYGTMARNVLASARYAVSPSLTPLGPPGDKPPLVPLLLAASIHWFGPGEAALRWISIAAAAVIAFACGRLAGRAAGPVAEVACAGLLVTLPWFADASRVVAAEIPLTALGALALVVVCSENVSRRGASAAGVLLGLAFLCKLWLAVLVAAPAAGALSMSRGGRSRLLPWLVGCAIATASLHLVAVALRQPASLPHWWAIYVGRSLVERVQGEGYAPYWRQPPVFYWNLLAHAFVLALPLVAVGLDWAVRRLRDPAPRALVLWLLGAAVLSLFRVKSGGYAYVVVPAWAAVAALGVHALASGHRPAALPLALAAVVGSPFALIGMGGEPLVWTLWLAAWLAFSLIGVVTRYAGRLAPGLAVVFALCVALAGAVRLAQRLPLRYHATGYREAAAALGPLLRDVAPERPCFIAPEAPAWSYYWFRTGAYWGTPITPWSQERREAVEADTLLRVFVVDARQERYGGWPDSATVRWLERSTREVTNDPALRSGKSAGIRIFVR